MKIHLVRYRHLYSRVQYILFFFSLMTIVVLPNSVLGKMNKGIHVYPEEMTDLPRWCQVRMIMFGHVIGGDRGEQAPASVKREYKKWAKVVGEDIIGFTHHYCSGLNWINRYNSSAVFSYDGVEKDRKNALNSALEEFRFMRGRLRPKHKLYYSMLMNEANVYIEQNKFTKAVRNYQEIIKLKPGYAFPYVKYAQLLKSLGSNADAIKVLQNGLKKTNGAKIIKQALADMGAGTDY